MPSEFDIIRQYFSSTILRADVVLGIGDDAAILQVPADHDLLQSVDTLVAGVHFPIETSAKDIAYKSLVVNLSDMAAMGAEPAWFTLAITLPNDDEQWLKDFSKTLALISQKYNVQLIGGDTTNGPLTISITINGFVPTTKALTRSNAKVGDKVYVSGTIGDAALALAAWKGHCLLSDDSTLYLNNRLNKPTPQIELGLLLRDYASSCIDVSDGLLADLGHITEKSNVGAKINFEDVPLSKEFNKNLTDEELVIPLVLAGGDDYELCFTVPFSKTVSFEKVILKKKIKVACIGEIEEQPGVRCYKNNIEVDIHEFGYQHF